MTDNDTYREHPEVLFEVHGPSGWVRVGSVSEVEPPGSLGSDEPTGRQVYMFGWLDGVPGVWRSVGGLDTETEAVRLITTTGFDHMADLAQGPLEMDIWHRRGPVRARFTLTPVKTVESDIS